MKIAIDFDGTVCKVMSLVCTLMNFKHGTNFTFKDVTDWNFFQKNGYEEAFWEIYNLLDDSDLRLSLRPYDLDTIDVLKRINELTKQPIEILTCNSEKAADSIQEWFWTWPEDRAPNFKVKCIGRATSKEKLELDYDFYIDDSPHMAEMIHEYPNKKMILMNAPWNQNIKENGQVVRVHRWKNVIPTLYRMGIFPPVKYGNHDPERMALIQKLNKPLNLRLDEAMGKTRDTEDLYYK
jgi:uncharacterized HAD superfamily protein